MSGVHGVLGDAQLSSILQQTRTIAVVGLSPRPDRPSHEVAAYLQKQGYTVVPVNPLRAGDTILGCPVYRAFVDVPVPLDIIDVFRRPDALPAVVEDAIAARSNWHPTAELNRTGALWVIWTQLGIINSVATERAHQAGFAVVENRCTMVEHARLGIKPIPVSGAQRTRR
jgi:predicted CoA-binding protein